MIVHFDAYLTYIPTNEQVLYCDTYDIDTNDIEEWHDSWQSAYSFIWEDGNYSCDCNRALFFERAKIGDKDAWPEVPCGHELYRLDKLVVRETGEIVYSEKKGDNMLFDTKEPRLIFGLILMVLMVILAAIVALGRVHQDSSYGLDYILGSLSTLAGAFAQWAFRTKIDSKKEEEEKITQ